MNHKAKNSTACLNVCVAVCVCMCVRAIHRMQNIDSEQKTFQAVAARNNNMLYVPNATQEATKTPDLSQSKIWRFLYLSLGDKSAQQKKLHCHVSTLSGASKVSLQRNRRRNLHATVTFVPKWVLRRLVKSMNLFVTLCFHCQLASRCDS